MTLMSKLEQNLGVTVNLYLPRLGGTIRLLAGLDAMDLIVTMDDATNTIYSGFLVPEEGTASTFQALLEVFGQHGLPLCVRGDHRGRSGQILCVQEERQVSNDNTVVFHKLRLQISIVTYAHRPKRAPRKKARAVTGPAIVTANGKRDRDRRRDADDGQEASPEIKAFFARMMRPPA
jgi:hypothetical protein